MKVGDEIETFDGEGRCTRLKVEETGETGISFSFVSEFTLDRRSPLKLTLGLNPLKGGNEEIAVRMAAAMEVSEIVPVFFKRSDVPIDFDNLEKRLERWKRFCVAETIVSGGAYLPKIGRPVTLRMFLEDHVNGVLFDEEAEASELTFQHGESVAALIGPEGGLERDEVDLARSKGLRIASFGPWVLRAELAGAMVPGWMYSRVL